MAAGTEGRREVEVEGEEPMSIQESLESEELEGFVEEDPLGEAGEAELVQIEATLKKEVEEAYSALRQLSFEENEFLRQLQRSLSRLHGPNKAPIDFFEALFMELELRVQERNSVLQALENIDDEREHEWSALCNLLSRVRSVAKAALHKIDTSQRRLEGFVEDEESDLSVYDWVVDVNLLSDLTKDGWKVSFSPKFYDGLKEPEKNALFMSNDHTWEGAVVAVCGLFNKGKTFVLNSLTNTTLPSGKRVSTKGLSFKHVTVDSGTNFVLLDSAGSYSPVKVRDELSVAEKEATEWFLLDLVFELSDYFVCVVNDFTSLDQRYLDRLTRSLQNSNKSFREVIVVHNMKEVTSKSVLKHLWRTQVTGIYSGGQRMYTKVAARNPHTEQLQEKRVQWFKTKYSRHIALGNEDSALGESMNPWAMSLLRYWLKSVFVPVNRKTSVVRNVIDYSNKKLSTYFKQPLTLGLHPGDGPYSKSIRPVACAGKFRLPQISLDASGLMLTRPDSFIPEADVIMDNDEYCILMDVPGMTAKDITVLRQNVVTIVKGKRLLPYLESKHDHIEKRERKYGDFTLTFRIPYKYQRRWKSVEIENGVLCIRYERDVEEEEVITPSLIEQRERIA